MIRPRFPQLDRIRSESPEIWRREWRSRKKERNLRTKPLDEIFREQLEPGSEEEDEE